MKRSGVTQLQMATDPRDQEEENRQTVPGRPATLAYSGEGVTKALGFPTPKLDWPPRKPRLLHTNIWPVPNYSMQRLFEIHITKQILIGLKRFRELLLARPVGAGAVIVTLQKCWKNSNGQNPRNGGSRSLWPSCIKYTTTWSTLTRIGTCRRLVEGTGIPGLTPFSITVRIHTEMNWNFPFSPGQLQLGMDLQPKLSLHGFKSKI